MQKKSLLFITFWLALLLFILHYAGMTLYLYWTFWWYDYVAHFLGGLTIGLLIISLSRFENKNWKSLLVVFILVFATGVAWEVFEYIYDIATISDYWKDTTIDLVLDMTGAIFACLYASGQMPKSSQES